MAELARRAGRPAAGLRELTGGNPLLVTEVLAAGDAGVPMTVRDLVLARLAGLPADAQEVVRLVAVVPTRAELWLLEEALRGRRRRRSRLRVSAGLLVVGAEAVGFRHELLRQAVEGSLSALARRELNRRVLEVLAGAPGRRVDVARLVHHAREAGDVEAVLRYAPEAARQAAAVAAHREAVGHYRAALAHAERLPAAARAELLEGYSVEAYLSGLSGEAARPARPALRIREAAGDPEQLGESLRWLSRLHWWDGSRREAEAAARPRHRRARALPPGHQLAMAYSNQAQLDMLANRTEAAMAWAARAIELARRLGDQETLTHALTNIGSARAERRRPGRAGRPGAGVRGGGRGRAGGPRRPGPGQPGHHRRGDPGLPPRPPGPGPGAVAFAQAHDLAGYAQHMLGHRARLRLDQGDWAGAEQDARAALAEPGHGGRDPGRWTRWCCWACCRPAAATRTPRRPSRRPPSGPSPPASCSGSGRWPRPGPSTPGCTGTTDRAAEEAAGVFELAVRGRPPVVRRGAGLLAAAGRRAAGGRRRWWPSRTGCCWPATGGRPPTPGGSSAAPTSRPWRWPAATRTRRCWRRWRCWTAWAPGRRPSGCAASSGSAATCASPAARPGPRPPTRPASPAGRSRCSGCWPRASATPRSPTRLSLSAKTVEHHVSALLAKLGVGSRREAAAAARRLGVAPAKVRGPGAQN